ncbi:MAG: hypothetical protein EP335_11700 [Alphaproteobacteria bacterium]|nr:MAG: hypothetical protein EP335_11700 [Alphaproteobacteria bacterium]
MTDHECMLPIVETVLVDLVPVAREIRSRPDFDHRLRPAVYSLNKYGQALLLYRASAHPSDELTRTIYADGRAKILPLIDDLMEVPENCPHAGVMQLNKLHHDMEMLVTMLGCGMLEDSPAMGHA